MIMKGLKLTMYYFLYLLSKQEFGQRNGNPLQYSCLENPVDRGAWWATVQSIVLQRARHDKQLATQHNLACSI